MVSLAPAPTSITRAALLPRVSTPEQAKRSSLETQERAMRAYCAERGYVVDERYVLPDAYTGTDLDERQQIQALRAGLKAGHVDVVLFYDVDRASRAQAFTWVLYSECRRNGARLEFVLREFEDTPFGRFALGVHAFQAEFDNQQRLEKTMRAKQEMLESGQLVATGTPAYGYRRVARPGLDGSRTRREPIRYEPHPDHAPTVERIIRLFLLHGQTLRSIAALLNGEKVATPATAAGRTHRNGVEVGGQWDMTAVGRVLRNPAYYGQAAARRYVKVKHPVTGKKVNRPRDDDERMPINTEWVPPLVPPDLSARYEDVVERLDQNRAQATRNCRHAEASLLRAGFVACGECGWAMTYKHSESDGRTRRQVYKCEHRARGGLRLSCHHAIASKPLDAAVWGHVRNVLTRPDVIERKLAEMEEAAPERDLLAAAEAALATARDDIAVLVEELKHPVGPVSAGMMRGQLADLESTYAKLEAHRDELLLREQGRQAGIARVHELVAWCRTIAANVDELTYEQRRLALTWLKARVTVWRAGHEPRWELRLVLRLGASEEVIQCGSSSRSAHCPTPDPRAVTLTWTDRDRAA